MTVQQHVVRKEDVPEGSSSSQAADSRKIRKLWSRLMMLIRRIHLYAGLFLLPWVILYGVTGAMFNHQNLFPDVSSRSLSGETLQNLPMNEFPTPESLADQVVRALSKVSEGVEISVRTDRRAEFTNDLMFEAFDGGQRYVIHVNPVTHETRIVSHPENRGKPVPVLTDVTSISLESDPQRLALQSVESILASAGINPDRPIQALGWTKLNFLADVNGQPARVTYVLKDGHIDVTRFTGQDGMSWRQFLLRLHTTHGQPPHRNSRWLWSLAVDAMAIAMITWGVSGILMWWQIKKTRLIGSVVVVLSVVTAVAMYLAMHEFYATTML